MDFGFPRREQFISFRSLLYRLETEGVLSEELLHLSREILFSCFGSAFIQLLPRSAFLPCPLNFQLHPHFRHFTHRHNRHDPSKHYRKSSQQIARWSSTRSWFFLKLQPPFLWDVCVGALGGPISMAI